MNAEVGTRNAEQQARVTPPRDLRERTKAFALDIVRLVQRLPRDRAADVIGRQLLRAVTPARIVALRHEAGQLVAITVASIRTARGCRGSVPRSAFRVPRSH